MQVTIRGDSVFGVVQTGLIPCALIGRSKEVTEWPGLHVCSGMVALWESCCGRLLYAQEHPSLEELFAPSPETWESTFQT